MEGSETAPDVALGLAIQRLRREAELTQQQLADRAQLPVEELRQIESGQIEADWAALRRIAYGIEVELADLFRLVEEIEAGD